MKQASLLTETQVAVILKTLRLSFPGRFVVEEGSVEVWRTALAGIDFELVKTGLYRAMRNCKYPPGPGDIIGEIKQAAVAAMPTASEAWDQVQKVGENCTTQYKVLVMVATNTWPAMAFYGPYATLEEAQKVRDEKNGVNIIPVNVRPDYEKVLHPLIVKIIDEFGGLEAIEEAEKPDIMRAQFKKAYAEEVSRRADKLVSFQAPVDFPALMAPEAPEALALGETLAGKMRLENKNRQ